MRSGNQMSPVIDRERLSDAALLPIADKLMAGERLGDGD